MKRSCLALASAALLSSLAAGAYAQSAEMSFFITSQGPGEGANLGGLEGADAHCRQLAEAVGAGGKAWRAYLSTSQVHARDRIGDGPWHNAKGEKIADDLASLHGEANAIDKTTGLDEKGEMVNGRGDTPNRHDILTASNADGTATPDTCGDWTSSDEGRAMVGHHDRIGLRDDAPSKSWNASHPSRGCSQDALRQSGGDGLFYCFAAD